MFKNPFSFDGRIRRLEFGISYLLFWILNVAMDYTLNIEAGGTDLAISIVLLIPMLWFFFAQRAKRCHDLNHNAWWQVFPGYFIWMIFEDGVRRRNRYGDNPKIPEAPEWNENAEGNGMIQE